MGFRNDEDARIHRIDALEGELDEKDAEIEALKAQLDAKREADDREAEEFFAAAEREDGDEAPPRSPATQVAPRGDVWSFDTHHPLGWVFGAVWIAVAAGAAVYMHQVMAMPWADLWAMLPVTACSLFLFHRQGLTLDKRAGTVTRTDRLFLFSWSRARPYAGKALTIDRRRYSSKDGDSHWNGHVFLGDLKLFAKREEEAQRLAKQVADFLGIACRQPSSKQMQRNAMLPLILTMVGVAIFLAAFFLREHLLR